MAFLQATSVAIKALWKQLQNEQSRLLQAQFKDNFWSLF